MRYVRNKSLVVMKTFLLFMSLTFWVLRIQAQNVVSIPDSNFLKALIAEGIDLDSDGKIQIEEASKVTKLYFDHRQIKDLTGIEAFTALIELDCSSNVLSSLDITKNTALQHFYCSDNQLTTIDVVNNVGLLHFHCAANQLSKVDISKNKEMVHIDCHHNKIDSLDLSNNTALVKLECFENALRHLVLLQNPRLEYVWCGSNPNLKEICITDAQKLRSDLWRKDNFAIWNSACATGVEEDFLRTSKTIVRIVNLHGQEIKEDQLSGGLYLYLYSDGSAKKVMRAD